MSDNPLAIADLPWSLLKKNLAPGRWLELEPMTFARARLVVTDGESVFDAW